MKFDKKKSGAHVINKGKVFPGYVLYEGKLIDEKGKVVREWGFKNLGIIDDNGDYYAQDRYEGECFGRFSSSGEAIWKKMVPIHHEIVLLDDKMITFTKEMHRYRGRDVDFCVIVSYDKNDGKELSRWSAWEHLKEIQKFHRPLELDRPKVFFLPETAKRKERSPWGGNYDYYRLNSLQVIPENDLGKKDKRFQGGNWLISFRHGSMIFILDKDTKDIVWKCIYNGVKDNIEGQHDVQMLGDGRMLIFDNGRYRGWSRVIEIGPVSKKVLWEYKAKDFFTLSEGSVQRLANGNTLICESEKGRIFEIDPDKKVVWEFYISEVQGEDNSEHPESFGARQWVYRGKKYEKRVIDKFINKRSVKIR